MARPVDPSVKTIPNCAQVQIQWSTSGRTFSNVLHGNWTGAQAPTAALAETLFTAVKGALTSSGWGALLHTDVSCTGVRIKDMRQPNLGYVNSSSAAASGTGSGTMGPLNAALVITQRTAQSGRGFFGRTYLAGMDSTTFQTHTQFTAAATTAGAAFLESIRTSMQTNTIPMVVAQRALLAGTTSGGAQLGPRAANTIPVTQCAAINARVDTQRRRLGR